MRCAVAERLEFEIRNPLRLATSRTRVREAGAAAHSRAVRHRAARAVTRPPARTRSGTPYASPCGSARTVCLIRRPFRLAEPAPRPASRDFGDADE